MKTQKMLVALMAAGVLGASGYGLYWVGKQQGMNAAPAAAAQSADKADASNGKKILYWQDPMVPGQKFDKPGKSPFMDMQLQPVYANDAGDEGNISISPRVQQNLGIRTAEVVKGTLTQALEAVGSVAYNERDVAVVQARSNGFIEHLYVRAPLEPVKKGQPLVELYIPDWIAAQEEYLSIRQMGNAAGTEGLLDGARQRMRLAGMTDEQIRLVASTGRTQARVTIIAPISGVVAELTAREGMTLAAGAPLFRINGLSSVWVNAEVPENFAAQLRPGNTVQAKTPALPGTVFKGKVSAILPEVNATTRTLKARIELANPSGQLVPGMFVTVNLSPAAHQEVLLVPSEAIIQTGKRSVVMVTQGEGKFQPVEVETGSESDGQTEIRKGLEAGLKVVVSGQFLIDSEASLKGTATRMSDTTPQADTKEVAAIHHGTGKVEKIGKDEVTLSHGPIASLDWPPMTMGFKLATDAKPGKFAVGDTVNFDIRKMKDGMFEIVAITPASNGSGAQSPAEHGNHAGAGK